MVDVDLRMHSAIDQVLSKIRPKITAILRTRGYYGTSDLILQFKTHVWGLIEINIDGYFHACSTLFAKIDSAQNHFLHELGLSSVHALEEYNFAPSSLRRNVGALGLLHKRVLGQCHPTFERLFPWCSDRFSEPRGRGHSKQLYGHWEEVKTHRAIFNRSIFMMVDIYNNLPQDVVDSRSVCTFQKALMHIVHTRCESGDPSWANSFCRRAGPDIGSAAVVDAGDS